MKKVLKNFKAEVLTWKFLFYVLYILFFIYSISLRSFFTEFFYALFSANLAILFLIQMFNSFKAFYNKEKLKFNLIDTLARILWASLLMHELVQIIIHNNINQFTVLYWNNFIFSVSLTFIAGIFFFIFFLFNLGVINLLKDYKFKIAFTKFFVSSKEFIKNDINVVIKMISKSIYRIKSFIFKIRFMLQLFLNKILLISNHVCLNPPTKNFQLI
ncbi:hypothetical protein CG007_02320 [Mesoplasma entomophilum]|uniref:hypothetical protein n=1 Tax=Mesoplasma entomophilum TaxID=2149 RepID=UPI000D0357B4|nr:hypothetical protein [Mesoplasma entomophilum]AVN60439.1 hypothetical protein CG007_02320 [Mesoplasma entomophilum]